MKKPYSQSLLTQFPKENAACEWKEFKNLRPAYGCEARIVIKLPVGPFANICRVHLGDWVEDKHAAAFVGIQDFNNQTVKRCGNACCER